MRRGPGGISDPRTMRAQRQHERCHQDQRAVDDMQRVDDELLVAKDCQGAERDLEGEQHQQENRRPPPRRAAARV
jgi:hypothetical protein